MLTNFVSKATVIAAAWLNGVDMLVNSIFNGASTNPQARTALCSDAPLEIVNGGTGSRTAGASVAALQITQNNLAGLRLLTPKTTSPAAVIVLGTGAPGDGGGGVYYYNSTDTTSVDNGGTIIVAADGGRYYLAWRGA